MIAEKTKILRLTYQDLLTTAEGQRHLIRSESGLFTFVGNIEQELFLYTAVLVIGIRTREIQFTFSKMCPNWATR